MLLRANAAGNAKYNGQSPKRGLIGIQPPYTGIFVDGTRRGEQMEMIEYAIADGESVGIKPFCIVFLLEWGYASKIVFESMTREGFNRMSRADQYIDRGLEADDGFESS